MAVNIHEMEVLYPDSDGEPMADNTRQFNWIVTIEGGLDALFRHDPDVFIAGDLLWYPLRGDNLTRMAPDALVAFGRPKGHRGSYRQWEENNIAPQVVFEVLSPGNTRVEMERKRGWYARFGVEEYYEYDPDHGTLAGWLRQGAVLVPIAEMEGFVSPRLGVRFGLDGEDLVLVGPDGRRFESYVKQVQQRSEAEARAEQERIRAEQAEERANRLAARLRELGLAEE
jgi:Uma2 family endonuclease